jgi:hypothetical protein
MAVTVELAFPALTSKSMPSRTVVPPNDLRSLNRRAETGGSAIDAAYTSPPDTDTVSGGPASAVRR